MATKTYKPKRKISATESEEIKIPASSVDGLSTVATSGSYNDLTNKPTNYVTTNTEQTITSKKTFNGEVKFGNTENFQGYYIKRMLGSLGIGTRYENLDSKYKDGTYHRMWRLRFPSGSSFWGKIKVTLYGDYSSFNASGVMSKSITCNFNTSNIYNNVGCYDGLGVNVEQDFRISEAIWNATANAWEVLIWQQHLNGNNPAVIMLECWTKNNTNYINAFNGIAAQAVELTQMASYSAQKASPTGGTKTVEWETLPVYENPLGEEIATIGDLSNKANLSGGNTFTGKQTLTSPPSDGYSIDASGYVKGSWLQAPSTGKASSNTGKVCVLDGSGWVYYRTPAEIVSDGGGAKASDIPTKTSQLTNDSGYTTNKGTVTQVKINGTTKSPNSAGLVDLGTVGGGGGVQILTPTNNTITLASLSAGLYLCKFNYNTTYTIVSQNKTFTIMYTGTSYATLIVKTSNTAELSWSDYKGRVFEQYSISDFGVYHTTAYKSYEYWSADSFDFKLFSDNANGELDILVETDAASDQNAVFGVMLGNGKDVFADIGGQIQFKDDVPCGLTVKKCGQSGTITYHYDGSNNNSLSLYKTMTLGVWLYIQISDQTESSLITRCILNGSVTEMV